ncbi:MAG TPA: VWA domain-containing protein [Gemmatimonadales bacterium]|nr:VWA domain-containing protein [Gemmatimonadales bacterium]
MRIVFDAPILLWLAPFVGLVVGGLAWLARRRRVRSAFAWSPELGMRAAADGAAGPLLVGAAAALACVALAGPRGGRTTVTTQTRALSLVIAVDISRSMLAEDVAPSRLGRALRESRRLVQDLQSDRIGLLAFAGRSYILAPITVDGSAIEMYLDGLDPDLASEGGTDLASVLAQGREVLGAASGTSDRVLVVFTDGEDHDSLAETISQAEGLKAAGIRLVLVAEGGEQGVHIPERDSAGVLLGYQVDADGQVIETARDDRVLQRVADAAEGTVVSARLADQEGAVRDLLSAFRRSPVSETRAADLVPRGWIAALAALLLLVIQLAGRRSAALIAIALAVATPVRAQRPSAGEKALDAGRPGIAAREFLDASRTGPAADTAFYDAGTAALTAGDFVSAEKALAVATRTLDPDLRYRALYNLGTAYLLQAAKDTVHRATLLEEAEGHLRDALRIAPNSRRAKWNLELAVRHRPPPPPSGAGGNPPPPTGGGAPPPPPPPTPNGALTPGQANAILNSVAREERAARERHLPRNPGGDPRIKDW